jgi:hypothetical protein
MGGGAGIESRAGRLARRRRRPVTVLAIAALALAALALPAASGAASKSPFKPGLYVGKTSQGYPVKLRLSVGSEACSGYPCLYAPNDNAEVYIAIPCPAIDQATNNYLALAGDRVEPSGYVDGNEEGFSKLVAKLKVSHHGTISGKLRDTETLEDGTKCDSGPVTLSAKLK